MKVKKSSKVKKTTKVYKTITSLVMHLFKSQPKIKSKEMILQVKKLFPASKINVYHYSWYKYQIKKGRYNGMFDKKQIALLG